MIDDVVVVMGVNYNKSERKYHLVYGHRDETKVMERVTEVASSRPSPEESALLVLMSGEEFNAFQRLRQVIQKRAIESNPPKRR